MIRVSCALVSGALVVKHSTIRFDSLSGFQSALQLWLSFSRWIWNGRPLSCWTRAADMPTRTPNGVCQARLLGPMST